MTKEELYYLSASELLKHIQAEKERLIKEKVIKKSKPLSTITDETVKEVGGNFETTYQTIKTTVQPEAATAYFERAEKNYNNRKFKESIPDYEKCYELDPKNDEALYRLGRAYQKTDDKDKAKKVFDELIKKFPNNKTARDAKLHYDD